MSLCHPHATDLSRHTHPVCLVVIYLYKHTHTHIYIIFTCIIHICVCAKSIMLLYVRMMTKREHPNSHEWRVKGLVDADEFVFKHFFQGTLSGHRVATSPGSPATFSLTTAQRTNS